MARQKEFSMPPLFWFIVLLETVLLGLVVSFLPYKAKDTAGKETVAFELLTANHKGSLDTQILMMEILGVFLVTSAVQVPIVLSFQKKKKAESGELTQI